MFLELLRKISVIDNVETSCSAPFHLRKNGQRYSSRRHHAKVNVLPVAHLRPEHERVAGEKFEVAWYRNGAIQKDLTDLLVVEVDESRIGGKWEVLVQFISPEIRYDPNGYTKSKVRVNWGKC
jgi:hypothetical protein